MKKLNITIPIHTIARNEVRSDQELGAILRTVPAGKKVVVFLQIDPMQMAEEVNRATDEVVRTIAATIDMSLVEGSTTGFSQLSGGIREFITEYVSGPFQLNQQAA